MIRCGVVLIPGLVVPYIRGRLALSQEASALFRSTGAANWLMVEGDIESATVGAFAEQ